MKDVEKEKLVKKLSKQYKKKEIVIEMMIDKCRTLGYNGKESERIIIDFFK